jgi:hypothetical protein
VVHCFVGYTRWKTCWKTLTFRLVLVWRRRLRDVNRHSYVLTDIVSWTFKIESIEHVTVLCLLCVQRRLEKEKSSEVDILMDRCGRVGMN